MKVIINKGNKYEEWYHKYVSYIFEVEKSGFVARWRVIGHPEALISDYDCSDADSDGCSYRGDIDMSVVARPPVKDAANLACARIDDALEEFNMSTGYRVAAIKLHNREAGQFTTLTIDL